MTSKLDEAREKAKEKYGTHIGPMTTIPDAVPVCSTRNLAIDWITGVGGLPYGRITELFGPPSCGKTTTAIMTAAEAQSQGKNILYQDFEHAMDKTYAKALGLDVEAESFLFSQPDSLEQGMNMARDLLATGELGVIICDSVARMTSEKELEEETGSDSATFRKPKIMAQALRQLVGELNKQQCMAIFLNHIQEVIDKNLARRGIKKYTTPGGEALKFYSSVRIEYRELAANKQKMTNPLTGKEEEVALSKDVLVKCVKDKLAPPYREAQVVTRFGEGFSNNDTILTILTGNGIIKLETGGVHRFTIDDPLRPPIGDKDYVKGRDNMLQIMRDSPEYQKTLEQRALDFLQSTD